MVLGLLFPTGWWHNKTSGIDHETAALGLLRPHRALIGEGGRRELLGILNRCIDLRWRKPPCDVEKRKISGVVPMSFADRPKTKDRHQLARKKKLGHARRAIAVCCLFGRFRSSCHSERSRGIWPRMDDTQCPDPDVSTALRFARHDRRRGAAFTLIELLVVISIIALLMAILLPTLSRVRKQARAVACPSQIAPMGHLLQCPGDGKRG